MLIIRDSQLRVFADNRRRDFAATLLLGIAAKYPCEYGPLTESGMRALIDRSIAGAVSYGLEREGHIGLYVELTVEYGEWFERSPRGARARRLLDHPSLPGPAKIEGVQKLLSDTAGGPTLRAFL